MPLPDYDYTTYSDPELVREARLWKSANGPQYRDASQGAALLDALADRVYVLHNRAVEVESALMTIKSIVKRNYPDGQDIISIVNVVMSDGYTA